MIGKRKKIFLFVIFSSAFLAVLFFNSLVKQAQELPLEEEVVIYDLPQILESGVLRASTNYNSTNYFIYRGEPMGFHLELLRLFATHLGVSLEIHISNDLEENLSCLIDREGCDLIALDLTVTGSRKQLVQFTEPHSQTRQVLVQRKFPLSGGRGFSEDSSFSMVLNQYELAGKRVHVQKNTAFVDRLKSLMEEIGATIYIVEREETSEQLIEMVARGEIDFTVSDEHIARLNNRYYSNIDVSLPISFDQHLAWAVRHGADALVEAINEWMVEFKSTRQYTMLYNKYYNNPYSVYRAKSAMHSLGGGRISAYDHYFQQYADILGWDWRLIASLAFQESRFNPEAVSWAGAFGLMQLMPETAESLNIDSTSTVADHIRAGVNYLRWLDGLLQEHIDDDQERIKFVLAAYNMGIGHVLDARRLAEKYGKNPNVWKDNVDYYVLNKSLPKYYNDPVVRFGFARGSEPYRYVYEILERYSHYLNALEG